MGRLGLRLRAFIDDNFVAVVTVLVLITALGGWLTYTTYAEQPTTIEERTVSTWGYTGTFDHGATVTQNNPVYPMGERLSNRSVYFLNVGPELNGSFAYRYRASDGGNLTATITKRVVLRGVEIGTTGDETPTELWRMTWELGQRRVDSLRPGETVHIPYRVNVSEAGNRTEQIRDELGTGEESIGIETTVHIEGTVNGRPVENTTQYALRIRPGDKAYRVEDPGPIKAVHNRTAAVEVEQSHGFFRYVASALLLALPLGAVIGLGAARSRNGPTLSTADRERLAYEADRSDFDEWVSTIKLPEEAFDRPTAEAASLGALVDFALDTDSAVVEEPDGSAFYVVHDEFLYTYRPPDADGPVSEPSAETPGEPGGDDDQTS